MKRFLLVLGFMTLAVGLSAQSMYDALRYSREDYIGTARTLAMGNAFTALGGDAGSIILNPAGSGVCSYSQVTITPGLNISSSVAQGTTLSGAAAPFCFGNATRANLTKFALPNLGLVLSYETGRNYGLKSFSLGLVMNSRSFYQDYVNTSGEHNGTSIAGSIAAKTSGINYQDLDGADAYYNYSWASVLGWKSGMISTAGPYENSYVGATEKFINKEDGKQEFFTAGPLNQDYARRILGGKTSTIINAAMNISDLVYIGANIGIVNLRYVSDDYIKESPVNIDDFEVDFGTEGSSYFKSLKYQNWYTASGLGVNASLGIIATPGPVRIGWAIHTPTSLTITEKWGASAETHYSNSKFDGSASTPNGEYKYSVRTPWRTNLGIAGTVAGRAVLSVDYEFCTNRSMKLNDPTGDVDFSGVNATIRSSMGATHQLRAGVETKALDWLSVRAGYTLSDTRCGYGKESVINPYEDMDHSVAAGLGFSTNGSFYADLAFRTLFGHKEYIYPYADYDYASDGSILHFTPEILTRRNLYTVVLTLGFRF